MRYYIWITSIILILFSSCATMAYVSVEDLKKGRVGENAICKISKVWNLGGGIVELPHNCTLLFDEGGLIKNGTIIGNESNILYSVPFIGERVTLIDCILGGKSIIRDNEVFVNVRHSQNEIQTLFDISGGNKIVFSPGVYDNIERILINGNVDADFSNSSIRLKQNNNYLAECFYMEPWLNKHINYVRVKNLKILGKNKGFTGKTISRRCIQLFHVSEVELDNITVDKFYGGPEEYKSDASDLLNKSRIGTCAIAIMAYDKCTINNCKTNDISKEIFWCVPNNNTNNITYFTNNKSTNSSSNGSSSFFTILDGRCMVRNNEVHNYNGSAFNAFCYDSEIANNKFYNGKRSIAIDLSEGTMYKTRNVYIHDNECINTKGLLSAYGEGIKVKNNRWTNDIPKGDKCIVINIVTRSARKAGGHYIGCKNNPELKCGSKDIIIENNICRNNAVGNEYEVRFACVYGDNISFSHNTLEKLSVPVVQLVEGCGFDYECNAMHRSRDGQYAELMINKGNNITVRNNAFSRITIGRNVCYTVHVLDGSGNLTYRDNTIEIYALKNVKDKVYVPCYVQDATKLIKADYFVKGLEKSVKVETRLDKNKVVLNSNIAL